MFQHWHSGGGIVAHRYNCLGKGEVENVCEDACKLLSTCSEHTSQNAIRASSFAPIDFAQCVIDVCECEGLVNIRGFGCGKLFLVALVKTGIKIIHSLRKYTLITVCVELLGL